MADNLRQIEMGVLIGAILVYGLIAVVILKEPSSPSTGGASQEKSASGAGPLDWIELN